MRPFLSLSFLLLLPLCAGAQTNVLTGNVSDYGLVGKRANVTLTLRWPTARTYGSSLIVQDPVATRSDADGDFAFTNILWGSYDLTLSGQRGTPFKIFVGTNTVGTVAIASLVTNSAALPPNIGTNYYTIAQIDALLDGIGSGLTNLADALGGVTITGTNAADYFVGDGSGITNIANLPAHALTNNQSTAVTLKDDLTVEGTLASTNAQFYPATETATGYTVSSATQATFDGAYTNSGTTHGGQTAWQDADGKWLVYSSAQGRWFLTSDFGDNNPAQSDFNVSSVEIVATYTGPGGSAVVAATTGSAVGPALTSSGNIMTESVEANTAEIAGLIFGTQTNMPVLEVAVTDSNAVFSMTASGQNRLTVAKPGAFLGLQTHRSVMIGANQDSLAPEQAVDIRNITGANTNWIDFSTSGTGADLWVEDNVQVGGDMYSSNATFSGTITGNAAGLTNVPNVLNIEDFGAVAGDANDDSTAIQAALDAVPVGGGVVFVPKGIFKVNAQLNVAQHGTIIRGQGASSGNDSSCFQANGNLDVIRIKAKWFCEVRDLSIYNNDADKTVATNAAIRVQADSEASTSGSRSTFANLRIYGFKYGLVLNHTTGVTVKNVDARDNVHSFYCPKTDATLFQSCFGGLGLTGSYNFGAMTNQSTAWYFGINGSGYPCLSSQLLACESSKAATNIIVHYGSIAIRSHNAESIGNYWLYVGSGATAVTVENSLVGGTVGTAIKNDLVVCAAGAAPKLHVLQSALNPSTGNKSIVISESGTGLPFVRGYYSATVTNANGGAEFTLGESPLHYKASTNTLTGPLTVSGAIYGNGSGITNLNADNIASGTLATERLPLVLQDFTKSTNHWLGDPKIYVAADYSVADQGFLYAAADGSVSRTTDGSYLTGISNSTNLNSYGTLTAETVSTGELNTDTNNVGVVNATNVLKSFQSVALDGTNLVVNGGSGSYWWCNAGSTNVYLIFSNYSAGQAFEVIIYGDGSTSKAFATDEDYKLLTTMTQGGAWTNSLYIGAQVFNTAQDTNVAVLKVELD